MRLYRDRRHHTCPVPGTPPAAGHHRARQIVPDRGVVAAKLIRSYLKIIFWPKFCVVLAFQVLKIL